MTRPVDTDGWDARIRSCTSFEALRREREAMEPGLIRQIPQSDFADWNAAVNRLHDLITAQAVRLAESRLGRELGRTPPGPYAFILFGSGGRNERTLWSDQDSALIYQDGDETSRSLFAVLSGFIEEGLLIAGYPPCDGKVSAGNPAWCRSLSEWESQLDEWFAERSFASVRHLLIYADARTVYGRPALLMRLKRLFADRVREDGEIMQAMLNNTLHHKAGLGPFGNLLTEPYGSEAGGFDIKYGAYVPMVNAVRWLAIRKGIAATSTLERLSLLEDELGPDTARKWREAFLGIMRLRAQTSSFVSEEGWRISGGMLSASQLTREVRRELKDSIRTGDQMQKWIRRAGGR